jgi:hypothetical protein
MLDHRHKQSEQQMQPRTGGDDSHNSSRHGAISGTTEHSKHPADVVRSVHYKPPPTAHPTIAAGAALLLQLS